jgi:3-methyladenine DNA glycosylase AlkD
MVRTTRSRPRPGKRNMEAKDMLAKLKRLGTEQNRKIFRRHGAQGDLYGVSFAHLNALKAALRSPDGRKGVDMALARDLWDTENLDARTLAAMIADPARADAAELTAWVAENRYPVVTDYLAKVAAESPHADALLAQWTRSPAEFVRRAGYALLGQLALKDAARDDAFFEKHVDVIEIELQGSANRAKEGMNNCLIAIGSRSEGLYRRVLKAAQAIGPVEIDHGETACQTFDIAAYLEKVRARKKK